MSVNDEKPVDILKAKLVIRLHTTRKLTFGVRGKPYLLQHQFIAAVYRLDSGSTPPRINQARTIQWPQPGHHDCFSCHDQKVYIGIYWTELSSSLSVLWASF